VEVSKKTFSAITHSSEERDQKIIWAALLFLVDKDEEALRLLTEYDWERATKMKNAAAKNFLRIMLQYQGEEIN
tara:strand:- start:79 stop:300 length:222 start_codon:yes stop_codon:yes gene_type:complete